MTRKKTYQALGAVALLVALAAISGSSLPLWITIPARTLVIVASLTLFAWLLVRLYQISLWTVRRRLFFSHFLIGVVPIPMAIILAALSAYILAGFFVGHLHRTSLMDFEREQLERAQRQLDAFTDPAAPPPSSQESFAFDYYYQGKRVGGAGLAPDRFPSWLTEPLAKRPESVPFRAARYVSWAGGPITLALATERGDFGVVGVFDCDLASAVRNKSGLWFVLQPADVESNGDVALNVQVRDHGLRLSVPEGDGAAGADSSPADEGPNPPSESVNREKLELEKQDFFQHLPASKRWIGNVRVIWIEIQGPIFDLATGQVASDAVAATVETRLSWITRTLFAGNPQMNTVQWVLLLAVTFSLLGVYAVASLIAVVLILGLSRAVNRLTKATAAVQAGNFSVRVPTRRQDQVGALQRSFNEMTAHLEELVAQATQKEILEKEVGIAREVQRGLLPQRLPAHEAADWATLFEPSAALGGDYFDLIELPDGRVAVIIADVSGHGLSSGLRMSMLKAGLTLLLPQRTDPQWVFTQLDQLVRSGPSSRFFVTACLALIDFKTGQVELTNAGHPPTYLLRQGRVEEIALASSPLGGLGRGYARKDFQLEPGDLLVWLSDGLIEAQNPAGELFGYERVSQVLAAATPTAEGVRHALVRAVEAHAQGQPVGDDRTLLVLRYRGAAEPAAAPQASA